MHITTKRKLIQTIYVQTIKQFNQNQQLLKEDFLSTVTTSRQEIVYKQNA